MIHWDVLMAQKVGYAQECTYTRYSLFCSTCPTPGQRSCDAQELNRADRKRQNAKSENIFFIVEPKS